MSDPFFDKQDCDRCNGDLSIRTCSWFTDEAICMECAATETEIKDALRRLSIDPADYEGCGEVPQFFKNHYSHPACGVEWEDIWTSTCDDKCPKCDAPISPYCSEELDTDFEPTKKVEEKTK